MSSNSCLRVIAKMEEFLQTYPQVPVLPNDEFDCALNSIYDKIYSMNISCVRFYRPEFLRMIKSLIDILLLFKNNDTTTNSTGLFNFYHLIRLSRLSARVKNVIILKKKLHSLSDHDLHHVTNYEIEQYVCDNYKSKIESFKTLVLDNDPTMVQAVIENFTVFLLDYIRFLSRLNNETQSKENIDLLLEVADKKKLLKNFHTIANLLSKPLKIALMKKLVDVCVDSSCDLKNCGFIKAKQIDCKLEASIMCYFIIQRICEYFELQSMHQTSKILSMFSIDNIFLIEDYTVNTDFEKLYEESVKLIAFNTHKEVKVLPSDNIEKCLDALHIILRSFANQLQNCPFAVVFLSMLSELVMAIGSDKDNIICLATLIIGYLDIIKLPSKFPAISYMFEIYQKLKNDTELEFISKHMCRMISNNLCESNNKLSQYLKDDLERVLSIDENWTDKSIIVSYVLMDVNKTYILEDETIHKLLWTVNENLLLSTQYESPNILLIYPYSFLLNMSITIQNEDCLFNNLAILDNYLTILFGVIPHPKDKQEIVLGTKIEHYDYDYFLKSTLENYTFLSQYLPSDFFVKCWKYILNPKIKNNSVSKKILSLCSPADFVQIIDIFKTRTVEIIGPKVPVKSDYYLFISQLWSQLLKIDFIDRKKKIRKEHVNHFCFTLNRTFIFNTKKIHTDNELILLIQLIGSLLKLSWVNKTMLMDCSLRIVTYVERRSSFTDYDLLKEAAELLIILFKCPNNAIKPILGLYVITFSNFLKKCWFFITNSSTTDSEVPIRHLYLPLHKLETCSGFFKMKKPDFEIICQYLLEDLINIIATQAPLKDIFMRIFNKIVFNLMDVCSADEMKQLMLNVQGTSLLLLENQYKEYQSIRFTGRL